MNIRKVTEDTSHYTTEERGKIRAKPCVLNYVNRDKRKYDKIEGVLEWGTNIFGAKH
jgi:hypothetical protein